MLKPFLSPSCSFIFNFLILIKWDLVAVMKKLWVNLDPLIHQTVQTYPVLSLFSPCFFTYLHYNFYFLIFIPLTFNVYHCLFIFTFFFISLNLLVYYLIVVYFVSIFLCLKLLHAYLNFCHPFYCHHFISVYLGFDVI